MKTVQECLRELDTEELVDSYLSLEQMRKEIVSVLAKKDTMTAKELWDKYREATRRYIEEMRTIPVEESDEPAILDVYEGPHETLREERHHGLVHISELRQIGVEAEDYSYVLCTHGEVAGFFVADTKLTQDNLLGLMTDMLYEASFFGYTQEEVLETIRETEEAINETESDDDDDDDPEWESSHMRLQEKPEPVPKPEAEKKIEKKYASARGEYWDYLRKKALREVIISCVD